MTHHILFWATVAACLLLTAAVIVTTRRALRAAGRDVTYLPDPAARAPLGYRPAHRRVIAYIGHSQPTPTDFADIIANLTDVDLNFGTYADLYLVPEETR